VIPLRGRAANVELTRPLDQAVWLLADRVNLPPQRQSRAFLIEEPGEVPNGYELYIGKNAVPAPSGVANYLELPPQLEHLKAGDVLSVSADGQRLRVLWRHRSRQNSVLLTERCDHYCLMCSQPPKEREDDWLLDEAFQLVRLLPVETTDIGFTGGEPTLHGLKLFELLRLCRNLIPRAGVHILSNGRRFSDIGFAQGYAAVDNPNMMVGIPIYGAEPSLHDYVVQSQGAFDATVRGILNLARLQQRVEVRVVLHKQTAPYLVEIADFISRNLPFVEQVALMGLEMIGFARANMEDVWIDPVDYKEALTEAVTLLDRKRVKVMVYNHQLCLIDSRVWPFAVKSISDWKNEYHRECLSCSVMHDCGGFFFSAKHRMSDHIKAVPAGTSGRTTAFLALTQ
jgi:His-Xaa-Ser system radical SAM maturase HxsC